MSGPSKKSHQMTSADSLSATSSQALESGAMPSVSPVGRTKSQSGRDRARVSRSLFPESEPEHPMNVTCGPSGSLSSASRALSLSLANRLRLTTDSLGSTLFVLTWKDRITPSGRLIPALRASGLRTSGSDCTSVPTPATHDAKGTDYNRYSEEGMRAGRHHSFQDLVQLATIPTPMAGTPAQKGYNAAGNNDYSRTIVELASVRSPSFRDHHPSKYDPNRPDSQIQLAHQVILATCATPTREDHKSDGPKALAKWEDHLRKGAKLPTTVQRLRNQVAALSTCATPTTEDSQCTGARRGVADTLSSQAKLEGISTPSSRDWKDSAGMSESGVDPDGSHRTRLDQLPRQAQLAVSGQTATGGTGVTGSTGQLNPAYSRWLMGLPPEWDDCAVTAMQSSRLKQPNLSKQ